MSVILILKYMFAGINFHECNKLAKISDYTVDNCKKSRRSQHPHAVLLFVVSEQAMPVSHFSI